VVNQSSSEKKTGNYLIHTSLFYVKEGGFWKNEEEEGEEMA
jgi:hypothetical protein